MAPTQLLFLSIIFLSVLPGADAVSTVSNVAVQSGRSVTIPCHYDRKYEKHVKYWCIGPIWDICFIVVRTDSPTVRDDTSISDDPTHHVFTVTLKYLLPWESGFYWCAVEIDEGADESTRLYLSVTADAPGLWVDQQEVAGVEGGHVSVRCHYNKLSSMKKWCRAKGSCVEVNSAKYGRSEIKDDRSENVFIVTVRDLKEEDAGWYWCATGEIQIPVHISITQKTTTVTTTTQCATSRTLCTSLPVSTATTSATATKPSTSNNLAVTIPRSSFPPTTTHSKSPPDLAIILMTSGILLLVVAVAMVTWKLWKKHKSVQVNTRARGERRNKLAPSENPADEVMYSSVILQNPQVTPSANQSPTGTLSEVIYSSVAQQEK